jgi:hypothetical protein
MGWEESAVLDSKALADGFEFSRRACEDAVIERLLEIMVDGEASTRGQVQRLVAAGLDFGMSMLLEEERELEVPPVLLSHARSAGRLEVPLDLLLRGYIGGYNVFTEHAHQAVEKLSKHPRAELRVRLQKTTCHLERTLDAVAAEHRDAAAQANGGSHSYNARLVRRILAGADVDATSLCYDFNGWHLALVLGKLNDVEALHTAARRLGGRLFLVEMDGSTSWAWIRTGRRITSAQLCKQVGVLMEKGFTAAIGEPGRGFEGWQLSHQQARAIFPYACQTSAVLQYSDVALLATIANNPVLARSMRAMYVEPLLGPRSADELLVKTVQAYLQANRNVSSAAAALNVSRQTVRNRLRSAEERLGKPLDRCGAEVEIALRLV